MIQILGLREFTDNNGVTRNTDTFFERGWRAPSIFELFRDIEKYVEQIPFDLRWNLYYTTANCTDEKRKFLSQDILAVDIDNIDPGAEAAVVDCVLKELNLPYDKVGVVYSGHGVHLLIALKVPFDVAYIEPNKVYWRAFCGRINLALYQAALKGTADSTAFSAARILRLPLTENRKKNREPKTCKLVQRNIERLDVSLHTLADIPVVSDGEHVPLKAFARLPAPDREEIEKSCGFIKHCHDTEEPISEPEWYAMLSIVARFDEGIKAAHEYSSPKGKRHPLYSEARTEGKIKHALEASGPRTCDNISQIYEGCKTCPHFHKITSPIQLVGEDAIRTKDTGFYEYNLQGGVLKRGKPSYDDLEKWFKKKFRYVSVEESETVMIYNGEYWEEMLRLKIHQFSEKSFSPTPSSSMCTEFENKLKRMNVVPQAHFELTGKLNFKNGVFDTETGMLHPHDPEYKFTYVIPYDYAPTGDCPIFKKFLMDLAQEDEEIATLLAEYMGYCISPTHPSLVQICAILYGDGANGKSVLISLLRELVGSKNTASIGMDSMKKETHRYGLIGKMFNAAAESPSSAFLESENFKAMVAGDEVEVKKLYHDPMMWRCSTKFLFACNDLPFTSDLSHGLMRRLLIIPFRATFSDHDGTKDPMILSKLLAERSDIMLYCLKKFSEVKQRGYKFTIPEAVNAEMEGFKEMSDVVTRFFSSMVIFSVTDEYLTIDKLYALFAMWCKETHQTQVSYGTFTRRAGKIIPTLYPRAETCRPRLGEGRTTGYKGLMVRPSGNF